MDRVHYAGGSILTGTAIAHALVDYAEALARAGTAASVVVPTVEPDGSRGESHILVGPSSQLLTVAERCDEEDPVDTAWVTRVREEAMRLATFGPPAPSAVIEEDGDPDWLVRDV